MKGYTEIDGKYYVSSSRASEISAYSKDYIGQLCRAKKVECRMVGRAWYVNEESLLEYKRKSEAALQTRYNESSFALSHHRDDQQISVPTPIPRVPVQVYDATQMLDRPEVSEPTIPPISWKISYKADERPLLPPLSKAIKPDHAEPVAPASIVPARPLLPVKSQFAVSVRQVASTFALLAFLALGSMIALRNDAALSALTTSGRELSAAVMQIPLALEREMSSVSNTAALADSISSLGSFFTRTSRLLADAITNIFSNPSPENPSSTASTTSMVLAVNTNVPEYPYYLGPFGSRSAASGAAGRQTPSSGPISTNATREALITRLTPGLTLNQVDERIQEALQSFQPWRPTYTFVSSQSSSDMSSIGQGISQSIGSALTNGTANFNGNSLSVTGAASVGSLSVSGPITSSGALTISGPVTLTAGTNVLLAADAFGMLTPTTTPSVAAILATSTSATSIFAGNMSVGGTVGIGTTTPAGTFAVQGSGFFSGDITAANIIATGTVSVGNFSISGAAPNTVLATDAAGKLVSTSTVTANNFWATSSAAMNYFAGSLGVGTTTPGNNAAFAVHGSSYISGDLTVGGNSVTLGNSTSNTLTINSSITSSIVPNQNATYDLGSPSFFWNNAYVANLNANNISAANTTISGTQNNTFTINSDNVSADAESETLIFYRGTVVPNALLTWNAAGNKKRFEFNQPLYIENQSGSTTLETLQLKATAGQTGHLFSIASSSGTDLLSFTADGNLGLGSILPAGRLANTSTAGTDGGQQTNTDALVWESALPGYLASFTNSAVGADQDGVVIKTADTSASTNALNVVTGSNVSRFIVKGNGNVGIGTTSPSSLFSIGNGLGNGGFYFNAVGLGIGSANPQSTLDVQGNGSFNSPTMGGTTFAVNTGDNVPAASGATQNGGLRVAGGRGTALALDMGVSNTNGYAWLQAANNANLATVGNISLNPNGGNVGIGTTSPYASFSITGTSFGTGQASGQLSPYLAVATSSTARPFFSIASTSGFTIDGAVTQPVLKSKLVTGGGVLLTTPYDVAISGSYAYAVSIGSDALQVIDVSDPANPVAKGSLSNGVGGAALLNPEFIQVVGNYAYIASNGSNALEIVDVSDPAHPVHAGVLYDGQDGATLATPYGMSVAGNYAYIPSRGDNALEIVDISDPHHPRHAASFANGTGGAQLLDPQTVAVQGNYAYVPAATSHALNIIDVTDPTHPAFKGIITNGTGGALLGSPTAVFVRGNYAYVLSFSSGQLEIVDVSNPANPVHKGSLANGAGGASLASASDVFVSGKYAYIGLGGNSTNAGIEIVDVSNPAAPTHFTKYMNTYGGAPLNIVGSIVVQGNYAYIPAYNDNAFAILDVGGATVSNANIGSAAIDNLAVAATARVNQSLYVGTGLNVGTNAMIGGNLTVGGNGSTTIGVASSTLNVIGNIGIATSTPWARFSIQGNPGDQYPLFAIATSSTAYATSTALIVDANGRVGIGTSSPSQSLSVQGNGLFSGALTATNINASGALSASFASTTSITSTGYAAFATGGGVVGIGTTTPTRTLAVQGSALISGDLSVANLTATGTLTVAGATSFTSTGTTTFAGDILARGISAWSYLNVPFIQATSTLATSTFAGGLVGPNDFVVQQGSGSLGIGTSSPSQSLSVQGNGLFSGNVFLANLTATGTIAVPALTLMGVSPNSVLATNSSGSVVATSTVTANNFWATSTTATNYFAGNVGIGTTTPSRTLAVQGNTLISGDITSVANITATGTVSIASLSPNSFFTTNASNQLVSTSTVTTNSIWATSTSAANYFAGKVGIGTSTPAYPLDVNGLVKVSGALTSNLGSVTSYPYLANSGQMLIGWNKTSGQGETAFISNRQGGNAGGFLFSDYSNTGVMTDIMRLSGAGTVGIGINIPTEKLTVVGNSQTAAIGLSDGGTVRTQLSMRSGLSFLDTNITIADTKELTTRSAWRVAVGDNGSGFNSFTIQADAQGNSNWNAGFATLFNVQNNGKNGFGTSSPSQVLSVQGSGLISGDLSLANLTATGTVSLASLSPNSFVTTNASNQLVSTSTVTTNSIWATSTSATNYVAGKLGIQTTSPGAQLEVNGGNPYYQIQVNNTTTDLTGRYGGVTIASYNKTATNMLMIGAQTAQFFNSLFIGGGDAGTESANNIHMFTSQNVNTPTGTERLTILGNGNVGIGNTSPFDRFSDTNNNILDASSAGTTGATSIAWVANGSGYAQALYQASTASNALGLLVKTAGTAATNRILTLGTGATQNAAGTDVFVVQGDGSTGIGSTSPWAQLSLNPDGISGPAFAIGSSTGTKFLVNNAGQVAINMSMATSTDLFAVSDTANTRKFYVTSTGAPTLQNAQSNFASASLNFKKSRGGDMNTLTAVQNGDFLSAINAAGYDGAGFYGGTAIQTIVNGTVSSTVVPADLRFSTTNSSGTLNEVMRLANTGNVGIGTTTPGSLLSIGNTGGINFSIATSTFSTTGGINLTSGCFAVNGVCVSGGGGSGSGTVSSGVAGQLAFYSSSGTTVTGSSSEQLTLGRFNATSTIASVFPYASTTALTSSGSAYFATTAGSVGIGTTSPAYKLSIVGSNGSDIGVDNGSSQYVGFDLNSNSVRKAFVQADNTNSVFNLGGDTGIATALYTAGTERVRITATGNVGIGTTSPTSKLEVDSGSSDANQLGMVRFFNPNAISDGRYTSMYIGSSLAAGGAGEIGYKSYPNTPASAGLFFNNYGESQDTQSLFIKKGGYVGIGTTTPTTRLSVYTGASGGTSYANTQLAVESAGRTAIQLLAPDNQDEYIFFGSPTAANRAFVGYMNPTNATPDQMVFQTSNTFSFGGGNVGIGTTSPASKLEVHTAGTNADIRLTDETIGANLSYGGMIRGYGVVGQGGRMQLGTLDNNVYNPSITLLQQGGNVGIGTTTPGAKLDVSAASGNGTGITSILRLYNSAAAAGDGSSIDFYAGAGNKNARIYNYATAANQGDLRLATANGTNFADALTILGSNQNVGIGTTTPAEKLTVADTSAASVRIDSPDSILRFTSDSVAKGYIRMIGGSTNRLDIINSVAGDGMYINSSGEVGVGTTTPAYGLVVAKDNAGSAVIQVAGNESNTVQLDLNNYGSHDWSLNSWGSSAGGGTLNGKFSIYDSAPGAGHRFTIDTSGNVGIGTTSPAKTLSVAGSQYITGSIGIGTTNPVGYALNWYNPTYGNGFLDFASNPSAVAIGSTDTNLTFWAGGSVKQTILTNGNVGIGTTSPNWPLQVSASAPFFDLEDTKAGVGAKHLIIGNVDGRLMIGTSSDLLSATSTFLSIDTRTANKTVYMLGTAYTATAGTGNRVVYGQWNTSSANPTQAVFGEVPTVGRPVFIGNWSSAGIWGIGPNSGGTDSLLRIGSTANLGTNFDAMSADKTGIVVGGGESGFGTSTPWFSLEIASSTPYLDLMDNNAPVNAKHWIISSLDGKFRIGTSSDLSYTSTSTALTIDSNQFVGIGTTSPASTLTVVGAGCFSQGAGVATVACGTAAGNIYYTAANTGNYDVAENYATTDITVGAGDIVTLDPGTSLSVKKASAGNQIFGIVSTAPGMILGGSDATTFNSSNTRPVALSGRVPVKVDAEGGAIAVGDPITVSSVPGVGKKARGTEEQIGVALEAWSGSPTDVGTIKVFVSSKQRYDASQFTIDPSTGYVGIGSTSPMYKLSVGGDIAATSFVNVSTRSAKTDISYLDDSAKEDILGQITNLNIAQYRYKSEPSTDPLRLGLIAEEAPKQVLAVGGKGVDIYKLSTFALAGIQEQQKQIDTLKLSVSSTTAQVSTSTMTIFDLVGLSKEQGDKITEIQNRLDTIASEVGALGTTTDSLQASLLALQAKVNVLEHAQASGSVAAATSSADLSTSTVGTAVQNVLTTIAEWTVSKLSATIIYADRVEAKTVAVTQGFDITDQATGTVWCVTIKNGDWTKVPWSCETPSQNVAAAAGTQGATLTEPITQTSTSNVTQTNVSTTQNSFTASTTTSTTATTTTTTQPAVTATSTPTVIATSSPTATATSTDTTTTTSTATSTPATQTTTSTSTSPTTATSTTTTDTASSTPTTSTISVTTTDTSSTSTASTTTTSSTSAATSTTP